MFETVKGTFLFFIIKKYEKKEKNVTKSKFVNDNNKLCFSKYRQEIALHIKKNKNKYIGFLNNPFVLHVVKIEYPINTSATNIN